MMFVYFALYLVLSLFILSRFDKFVETLRTHDSRDLCIEGRREFPVSTFFGSCQWHIWNYPTVIRLALLTASMLPLFMIIFGGILFPITLSLPSSLRVLIYVTYTVHFLTTNIKAIIQSVFPNGHRYWGRPRGATYNSPGLPSCHATVAGCWMFFASQLTDNVNNATNTNYAYYAGVLIAALIVMSRWFMRQHTTSQLLLGYLFGYKMSSILTNIVSPLSYQTQTLMYYSVAVGMLVDVLDEWVEIKWSKYTRFHAQIHNIVRIATYTPFVIAAFCV
jgi:hypothetical protein